MRGAIGIVLICLGGILDFAAHYFVAAKLTSPMQATAFAFMAAGALLSFLKGRTA